MRGLGLLIFAALSMSGCAMMSGAEPGSKEFESNVSETEANIMETKTLSELAALETNLSNFIRTENRIPKSLTELVPKYLSDIPTIELPVSKHKPNNGVKVYPPSVMRDGLIDGTRLLDTGKWGYTFNDRQVIIFVDCTHNNSRGAPWYQERGVH